MRLHWQSAVAGALAASHGSAAPFAVRNWLVVPYEEARMRQRFGQSYEAYCAKVRRWI